MDKDKSKKPVFVVQWHVTNNCDQRCSHCYIWQSKEGEGFENSIPMSMEEVVVIIDDYLVTCEKLNALPKFAITGGDPLLYPYIWELLAYVNKKAIPFTMMGNPFHLNDEVCSKLYKLGLRSFQMSLDGLKGTHDNIRKKGSFEATLSAVPILQHNNIKATIMSTVSRLNYQELPELVSLLVDKKIDAYTFARYCPTDKDIDQVLSPQEYKGFLTKMWETYETFANSKTMFGLKDHLWILFLYEKGLFKPREEDLVFEGCGCGIQSVSILADYTVYACRRFKSPIGKVIKQSLYDIFLGSEIEPYRDHNQYEKCNSCELVNYCRGCHAVSYGVTGNFFSKDPCCWK